MDPARALVVYYSRTGTTETVARAARDELGCEIEAIHDAKYRHGLVGILRSGFDAPSHVSAPGRTYLFANRERIRRVAFFCTHRGSGSARVLRPLQEIWGRRSPLRDLAPLA